MAKQHSPKFLKIVQDAKSRVRETTVEAVKQRLDAGEQLTLVDVREESEWAAGRLPGAVHLGKGVIERDAEKVLPDEEAEIILYCGGGFRSALAADNLQKMGYRNVLSMDGGFSGWKSAGLPITAEAPATAPTQASHAAAEASGDSLKKQGDKLGGAVP